MKYIYLILTCLALSTTANANYLRVNNVSYDLSGGTVDFDITWNNSWRVDTLGAPNNWDAAWVFVKWRDCNAAVNDEWTHGVINTTLGAHTFSNLQPVLNDGSVGISPAPDNLGVMLRHPDNGIIPSFPSQVISLDITNLPATGDLDLRVMGIEMVYVTQGDYLWNASTLITSQPTVLPNGYEAFHCMKYEISQQQYAEFLNTLPATYATARYYAAFNQYRNRVTNTGVPPNQYFSDRPDRAANGMSWRDLMAYLDWSALRPMGQDEFTKACRGAGPFITGEYAWGTASYTESLQFNSITEDGTEQILTPNANYNAINNAFTGGDAGSGPHRVGIYATASTTTREQTGATYYGIMEMSGNVWEMCVHNSYNSNGFDGTWGNGYLDATAFADVPTWPLIDRGGFRGGSWYDGVTLGYVTYITSATVDARWRGYGGRGVR